MMVNLFLFCASVALIAAALECLAVIGMLNAKRRDDYRRVKTGGTNDVLTYDRHGRKRCDNGN